MTTPKVAVLRSHELAAKIPQWETWLTARGPMPLSRHPGWLLVLQRGLKHEPYCLELQEEGKLRGLLPLGYVRSFLFGRFLTGMPYLNYGGPIAENDTCARLLIDSAVDLAHQLKVRHLELREEQPTQHEKLTHQLKTKVHMRLPLPTNPEVLWKGFRCEVRNQVRKGQKNNLTVAWGGLELLNEFYDVFSINMRDLGTPVYGRALFEAIFQQFPDRVEFCVVRKESKTIAAGYLAHGWGITEVPSASSLREFNSSNANMLMYWNMLERAVQRGSRVFDFGRSSEDSNTYRFKKQWGAAPHSATWQYHVLQGDPTAVRPDNPKYQRAIRWWQKMPLSLSRFLGPKIVRGIP